MGKTRPSSRGLESASFARAEERYREMLGELDSLPPAFCCRAQALFEEIRNGVSSPKTRIKTWVAALILSLCSLPALLRAKVNTFQTVHYLIDIRNSTGIYDRRSSYVLEVLPASETLNFFHVHKPRNIFSSWSKRDNAVYFESLWKVVEPFWLKSDHIEESVYKTVDPLVQRHILRAKNSERQTQFWQWLFRWLGIKRMVALDDSRHTGELRMACKREGIETAAYMHARFNKYHVGLSEPCFDKYLVWAPIWKDQLEHLNSDYKNSKIIVSGHPRLTFNGFARSSGTPIRILWLGESNIDYYELNPFADALNEMEEVEVFFRGKKGEANEGNTPWKASKGWASDDSPDFLRSLGDNKITLVLGTHSTALLESWLVGVPALMLNSSYDYAWHLVEEGLIPGCFNPEELNDKIRKITFWSTNEIQRRREMIWGANPEWNPKAIQEWLE